MSINIGLYDFFAYTIPGVFYLILIGFWINALGLVKIDLKMIDSSALSIIVIAGAGYIIGQIIDPIAYRWFRLFYKRNSEAVKYALDEYHKQHPWLPLKYKPEDWSILFRGIKSKSLEAAKDIEQHNASSIMLRNIGFAFFLVSVSCLIYFFVISSNVWNIFLFLGFLGLSIITVRRSRIRRHWFYLAVFEAFAAHYLLDDKLADEKKAAKNADME